MTDILDVRGLSCPQPVFETRKKMQSLTRGSFIVKADSPTARDNIIRLAGHEGWKESIEFDNGEFRITLTK
jgi:tRNA 2-thiouridine synthesizing protein A